MMRYGILKIGRAKSSDNRGIGNIRHIDHFDAFSIGFIGEKISLTIFRKPTRMVVALVVVNRQRTQQNRIGGIREIVYPQSIKTAIQISRVAAHIGIMHLSDVVKTRKNQLREARQQLLKSGLGVDLPKDDMKDDLSTTEQQTTDNDAILTDHLKNINKEVYAGELEARLILEEHGVQLTGTVAPVLIKQLHNTGNSNLKFNTTA